MTNHFEAAVSAVMARAHLAGVAVHELPALDGRRGAWVEVVYRGLSDGPDAMTMRQVIDSVSAMTIDTDPRPFVSFVAEEDLAMAAAG